MITLSNDLFIAKGGERKCYIHPDDPTKLVKIQYDNSLLRHQNILDLDYYQYLSQKLENFDNIATFFGEVETNFGSGLIFGAVKDYDGKFSKTFEDVIKSKKLTHEQELALITELARYLKQNMIVFGDVVLSNILCQELEPEHYKLVIVDGLGARRFNFKYWLQNRSNAYSIFRIKMQHKKMMRNYYQLRAQFT